MKIYESTLRSIIRKRIILEQGMMNIMSNPYEDLTVANKVANYALNDDIEGALADPQVNTGDLDLDLDNMRGWVNKVGTDPHAFSEDSIVPDNWDLDLVYEFMEDLERAWYDHQGQQSASDHQAAPNVGEREVIGYGLGYNHVLPEEIKGIEFQVRRRGGKPSNINLEDDNTVGNISVNQAEREGFTLDDIIAVLVNNGAKERKKRKPVRHTPPMYD